MDMDELSRKLREIEMENVRRFNEMMDSSTRSLAAQAVDLMSTSLAKEWLEFSRLAMYSQVADIASSMNLAEQAMALRSKVMDFVKPFNHDTVFKMIADIEANGIKDLLEKAGGFTEVCMPETNTFNPAPPLAPLYVAPPAPPAPDYASDMVDTLNRKKAELEAQITDENQIVVLRTPLEGERVEVTYYAAEDEDYIYVQGVDRNGVPRKGRFYRIFGHEFNVIHKSESWVRQDEQNEPMVN